MALRKWSIIEDELKKSGMQNPAVLKLFGELCERHRVQHEQIMTLATFCSNMVDKFAEVIQATNYAQGDMKQILERMGISKETPGVSVKSLEGDEEETGSTYHAMRDEPGKKH